MVLGHKRRAANRCNQYIVSVTKHSSKIVFIFLIVLRRICLSSSLTDNFFCSLGLYLFWLSYYSLLMIMHSKPKTICKHTAERNIVVFRRLNTGVQVNLLKNT